MGLCFTGSESSTKSHRDLIILVHDAALFLSHRIEDDVYDVAAVLRAKSAFIVR